MTKIATSEVLHFDFDDGNIQYSLGIKKTMYTIQNNGVVFQFNNKSLVVPHLVFL